MKHLKFLSLAFLGLALMNSCKKDLGTANPALNSTSIKQTSANGTLAIGTLASLSGTTTTSTSAKDSLYLVNCFSGKLYIDTLSFASLPAAITTYLTANYSGYTGVKAFKILDSAKVLKSYILVIKYNNNLIGIKFSSSSIFVAVLEQRGGRDLEGPGFHEGGEFNDRDGKGKDTLALSALPTSVKSFFTSQYPTDTLLHAALSRDSVYELYSQNKGMWETSITKGGKLVSRTTLGTRPQKPVSVSQANLPKAISTYLASTYPNYVFVKAYSESVSGVVQEYLVVITQNSTQYALDFDGAGIFVKAKTIR